MVMVISEKQQMTGRIHMAQQFLSEQCGAQLIAAEKIHAATAGPLRHRDSQGLLPIGMAGHSSLSDS